MTSRSRELAVRAVDVALARRGYAGTDLLVARASVRDWARARLRPGRSGGSLAGVGVVIPRPGRAELVPIEVPLATSSEVTIAMFASAVSPGTERAQWLRLPNAQPALPFRPGYSGAGLVVAVGADVTHLSEGDLVAVPRVSHASVATLPAAWAVRVPTGVPIEEAALVYLAIISGYGVRRAGLKGNESVCVFGAGPIGTLAIRLARLAGAGPLTVVAQSRRHETSAAAIGARFRLIDEGPPDPTAVVIDATGDPRSIGRVVAAARDGGTVVLLGSPRGVSESVPVAEIQRRGIRLVGAHISALAVEAKRAATDPFEQLATTFLNGVAAGTVLAADLAGVPINPLEVGLMYRRLAEGTLSSAHLDWRLIPEERRAARRALLRPPLLPARSRQVSPVAIADAVAPTVRQLRFAIVGCGDIGLSNARAVARAANAELVLVYDPVRPLAVAAAGVHGGAVVDELHQAMNPGSVDAVLLSVPHDRHEPLISQAAAAGLHVIVEKPLAVDLVAATAAVDAAERAGVILSVCFPYRYETAPVAARKLIQAGALGTFRGATIVFHADKPDSYWRGGFSGRANSSWRSNAEMSGGGVLIMNLAHHIDLLKYLTGCEVLEVGAVARTPSGQEIEDEIAVSVSFDGGAVGTVFGSASTRGAPSSRFEMWGDLGTVQLEPEPRVYTERAVPGVLTGRWNALPQNPVDERRVFVEHFAAAVFDQREPDVTALDGLAVQAIVQAVYESVRSGRRERVAPVGVRR